MHIYINKNYLYKSLVFFVALATSALVYADPTAFIYQGQIIKPDTTPLESNPVSFTIQIFSSNADNCLLYEETHSVDMTGSGGLFSLPVGSGSQAGVSFEDTSSLNTVINNNGVVMTPVSCATAATSYTSVTGDSRRLRLTFDDGSGPITLSQDHNIQSVPYANYASRLGGLEKSDFIQANGGAGFELTQANINSLFTTANHGELLALIGGTSTQYAKTNPTGAVSFNNQKIEDVATPTVGTDAANKNYVDANIGGSVLDVAGVGPASGDGRVLTWDQANNKWVTAAANTTDATKLPLAGGAMTGNITMGGNQILGTGHITQAAQSTVTIGAYTTAQQTTLVGGLTAANAGAMWFNSTTGKLMWWDGSTSGEVADSAVASGDITEVNTNVGSGLSGGVTNGAATVQVVVDNASVEIATNTIQVKDGGITNAKIATVSVGKITSGATEYFGYMPAGTECLNNQVLKWNSVNDRWLCASDADGGLTSLNGLTGGTQTFGAPGSAGTAPAWVSSGTTHTMNIPLASGAGVTSGTISKTDYDAFSAKQGTALANTNIRVGNAGGVATAVSMSGDATIANTGAVTIANNVITTVKILDANVTDAKIAAVGVDKITSGGTKYFSYMPAGTECGNNEILKWDATNDRWLCAADGGISDHGALSGLGDDDHTQYVLLTGRAGGQLLTGGTAASEDLILESTSHGTKGDVILNATGGNVGIGTTAPREKLEIDASQKQILLQDSESATGFWSLGTFTAVDNESFVIADDGTNPRMTIQATGNVGIGTTVPSTKLHIESAKNYTGVTPNPASYALTVGVNSGGANIGVGQHDGIPSIQGMGTGTSYNLALNPAAGNVGIGTTSPAAMLQVGADDTGTSNPTLRIGSNGTGSSEGGELVLLTAADYDTTWDAFVIDVYEDDLRIRRSGIGNDIVLTDSGNVGIGTTSPSAELQVGSSGTVSQIAVSGVSAPEFTTGRPTVDDAQILIGRTATEKSGGIEFINSPAGNGFGWKMANPNFASGSDNGSLLFLSRNNSATWTERMRISLAGNVGIGTTSPAVELDVDDGVINASAICDESNSNCIDLSSGVTTSSNSEAGANAGNYIINTDSDNAGSDGGVDIQTNGSTVASITSSGNIQSTSGAATTPGLSFTGDTNTGLFNPAADTLSMAAGGVEALRLNTVASGVNYVEITPAALGDGPIISTDGADTNIDLNITPKGTGNTVFTNGNVGIGTTTPKEKLHVIGDIVAQGADIYINHDGATNSNNDFITYNDGAVLGSTGVYIFESDTVRGSDYTTPTAAISANGGFFAGNVGVGTTSPIAPLSFGAYMHLGEGGGATASGADIRFSGDGLLAADGTIRINIDGDNNATTKAFIVGHNTNTSSASELFRIQENGNVGVGTTAPSYPVDISNTAATSLALRRPGSSQNTNIRFNNDAGDVYAGAYGNQFGIGPNADLNNSPWLRITNTGNVGLGTTSPSAQIEVRNDATATHLKLERTSGDNFVTIEGPTNRSFRFDLDENGATDSFQFRAKNATAGVTDLMVIEASGNVGIGTATPGAKLEVNGDAFIDRIEGGQINGVGNFHLDSQNNTSSVYLNWYGGTGGARVGNGSGGYGAAYASAFTVASDRRLKKDIQPIQGAIEKISQLQGVEYHFNQPGYDRGKQIGLIAQDVEKIFPETISQDADGLLTVNYIMLISPLIESIKTLSEKVQALFTQSAQQERRIASNKEDNIHQDEKIKTLEKQIKQLNKENKELKESIKDIKLLLSK